MKEHSTKCASLKTYTENMLPVAPPCDCDGYHTFSELYDHRIELFITLCRNLHDLLQIENPGKYQVWRSGAHSDGSTLDDWFILGIGTADGRQITYHLPNSRWEDCFFAKELVLAPKWDGHTSDDVLERLKTIG